MTAREKIILAGVVERQAQSIKLLTQLLRQRGVVAEQEASLLLDVLADGRHLLRLARGS